MAANDALLDRGVNPESGPCSRPARSGHLPLLFALLCALGPVAARAATPPPPNLIIILIDDLGWADIGCNGSRYYQTPNINRLASQGLRFTQAYAACAVCSPTRASILTGKYPARLHLTDWIPGEGTPARSVFRVPEWRQYLPREEVSLAAALKPRGYATASIGKWHLGKPAHNPEHYGFDQNIGGGYLGHPASYFWPYGQQSATHRVPALADRGGQAGEYLTDRLTDEALCFIEAKRRQPFFLYLAHYAVHTPLMAKEELRERAREQPPSHGQSNAVYAAMVQSVDESVGRILAKLDQLGLAERTVVLFTSDNGGLTVNRPPSTANGPLRAGKGFPYEGGIRVPLIIRAPGVTMPGGVCAAPVMSIDFFPTLLELAGAGPQARRRGVDGRSLVPLLKGRAAWSRPELFWHYPHYWNGNGVTPYSIVRQGDWKLIRFYEAAREELYYLPDDVGEARDLAAARGAKRRELSRRLDRWLHEVGAQLPAPR